MHIFQLDCIQIKCKSDDGQFVIRQFKFIIRPAYTRQEFMEYVACCAIHDLASVN